MARERTVSKRLPEGIYKRGKKYRVRTTYNGKSISGTYASLAEAKQGKQDLITKAKDNEHLTTHNQNATIKDCLLLWRDKVIPVKCTYVKTEQNRVDNIINKFDKFVNNKVAELTSNMVATEFIDIRRKHKGRGNKYISRSTIKEELNIIRRVLDYAHGKGIAVFKNHINPIVVRSLIADIPNTKRKRRILTDLRTGESIEKEFLKACSSYGDGSLAYFVELAIYTACRRGELLSLCWEDIDFDKRLMTVKNKNTKKREEDETRLVPLGAKAMDVFNRIGIKKRSRVFTTYSHPDSITGAIRNLRKKKQYKGMFNGISPHSFRHEAVTRELNKGLTSSQVQMLSGHTTTQMLDNYSRQIEEMKKSVVDLID